MHPEKMWIVLVILAIAVGYALVIWVYTILMIRVSQYTVRDLRRDLFAKLQTLPVRFFDQRPHGELMSYLTNDVENISLVLAENVTTFMSSLLIVVGMVVVMLSINVPLALVSIIVLPATAYFTRYVANHTRQGFREQQESLARENRANDFALIQKLCGRGSDDEAILGFPDHYVQARDKHRLVLREHVAQRTGHAEVQHGVEARPAERIRPRVRCARRVVVLEHLSEDEESRATQPASVMPIPEPSLSTNDESKPGLAMMSAFRMRSVYHSARP